MRHPICTLLLGHAVEALRSTPDDHFHTCVTSPPYYGLRSYSTEPVVWDGDPDHSHLWMTRDKKVDRHHSQGLPAWSIEHGAGGAHKNATSKTFVAGYARCECGAVRCELGHEDTPDLFVQHLVQVFRAVRRVLRPDGTCWVVIGDSYARDAGISHPAQSTSHGQWFDVRGAQRSAAARSSAGFGRPPAGTKHKDLLMIPAQFALAMRADGWWLRQDIAWVKANVLPESVDDRPTNSFEHVFLLAKSEIYFYDKYAVLEPNQMRPQRRPNGHKRRQQLGGMPGRKWGGTARGELATDGYPEGRNLRNVWDIPTRPFSGRDYVADLVDPHRLNDDLKPPDVDGPVEIGPLIADRACSLHGHLASWRLDLVSGTPSVLGPSNPPCTCLRVDADHFAVFPPELAATPIKAGASEGGCCSACGAPRVRVVEEKARDSSRDHVLTGNDVVRGDGGSRAPDASGAGGNVLSNRRVGTSRFSASCECQAGTVPCRVLDIFGGSGTTALTAGLLGRDATLVDMRRDYIAIQAGRLAEAGLEATLWDGTRVSRYRRAAAMAALTQHGMVRSDVSSAAPAAATESLFEEEA